MRTFGAFIAAIALTAVTLTGCAIAPEESDAHATSNGTTEHSEVTQQPREKNPPTGQSPESVAPVSTNPINVGDVVWDGFATSGGSSGDQTVIEAYMYVITLTPEQLAAYEAAGNQLGHATTSVVEQLCPAAVIDSLRVKLQHQSVDITFTVELAAT